MVICVQSWNMNRYIVPVYQLTRPAQLLGAMLVKGFTVSVWDLAQLQF
jgi:hypothetical protein